MKQIKYTDNLFRVSIVLFFDCTFIDFKYHLKKNHGISIKDDDDMSEGSTICFKDSMYIWFDDIPDTSDPCFIGVLVHELGHCAFHVLNRSGIPIGPDANEEMFLYLQSFYAEEFLKKITKTIENKKKRDILNRDKGKNNPKTKRRKDAGQDQDSATVGAGDAESVGDVRRERASVCRKGHSRSGKACSDGAR